MAKRSPRKSAKAAPARSVDELQRRLLAFVIERFPFAAPLVSESVAGLFDPLGSSDDRATAIDSVRGAVREKLEAALPSGPPQDTAETTPWVTADERLAGARCELLDAVDGLLRRESIAASFTTDERREMLRGMLLTRATDNQLKQLFLGGQVRHSGRAFQGKGFRSLGQEAIYAAPLRMRRGADHRRADGSWGGDIVAPLIRDLGAALAMRPDSAAVYKVLSAQMGKAGPPMEGKDLHIGDMDWGVLPATAPLSIPSVTVAGLALAFAVQNEKRVAVSFIGEGGSSLGEWHEAINICAARRLPAIFCLQNNQTALSTPVSEQSSVRVFADKAQGYGIPGISLDGTDPEAIAAAFAWAADRAREGLGPTLIELIAMRMCGHAHHDDMLYMGKEQPPAWDYRRPTDQGYADREAYERWAERDPILTYATRLSADGVIGEDELETLKKEVTALVAAEADRVIAAPWPASEAAGTGVLADEPPRRHVEVLESRSSWPVTSLPPVDGGPPFDRKGATFLEALMLGVGDALRADPRVFVFGQDVGGRYGNAFLLLRPLLEEFGDRILNSPLCEAGIIGACVGSALAGQRPIGEIQFNDFVATGFNQLVNNAAKTRYRWGGDVPMVLRMPWGGLRRAGPYHSQNTEPWFYRTPGLKIVTPSTPYDARALFAAAVADPDPVLFYEHIGLYRDPKIKQAIGDAAPDPLPLGRAALRRAGSDLAIVSYGAYVHVGMRVAETLAGEGIEACVLDLRSLVPLDRHALLDVARHCGKLLIIHDSPPLEDAFLPGEARIEHAARLLAAY
jgi:2-oxoisovalerate dehydrogenase E1 component